uniref:Replication protein A 70 kDa DNA-binding subunit B/D first OB fold domain-containing protein n=1 Tax=Noccaea caerulescens TaxID=107243 RepID=A0A1J3K5H2_NOCCA
MPLDLTPVSQLNSMEIIALMSRSGGFHPQDKPEKGYMIQGYVKTKLVKKFKNQLKEGECPDIMNLEVLENNGDYRGTTHLYKISFLFLSISSRLHSNLLT